MRSQPPEVSGARPLVGHAIEFLRDPVSLLERGRHEHGNVYTLRLGRKPAVVLLAPEHGQMVFRETDKRLSLKEGMPFFTRMFDPEFYFFAGPDEYRLQRELVLPRFRSRQLEQYLAIMESETTQFVQRLGGEGEFDLIQELGPLVMRIAAHAFLGPDFSARIGRDFFEEFRRFSGGMDPVTPGWLPMPHLVRSRRSRDRLRTALARMIRECREQPIDADTPDFLQVLSQARYADGMPVPDLVLVNMVLLLTWAGHETTTGHVSWALIDLLRNPGELAKVLTEQREVLVPGEPLRLKQAHELSALYRALHESERLHPVAFVLMRSATAELEVDGYTIADGSTVFLSPAVTHRLPELFEDPDAFQPDRYLAEPRSIHDLIGFGGGLHRCLGVHFAYLEMQVVVTRLLEAFELTLVDPDPQPTRGAKTKWPQSPCRVHYRRRADRP